MRGPGWSGVILVSLIVSLGVVFGVRLATEHGILPDPSARRAEEAAKAATATADVPALEGMSLEAASELLQTRGLTVLVRDKQSHPTIPPGSVTGQDPLPGSVLPLKAPVAVTLSSGKSTETAVPELAGHSFDEAVRMLEEAGLKVGALAGPDSGERKVERTVPAAGSLIQQGTAIALTLVSAGVPVPKVVGLRFAKAKQLLEESGFKLGKVRDRYNDYGDPLVVLDQTPSAGANAPKGSAVDIIRNAPD